MNILFYEELKHGRLGTGSVHIYELVSGLTELGHKLVLMNTNHPRNEAEFRADKQSLWRRIRNAMLRWPILKPIMGEAIILWLFLCDLRYFILALIIIARHKRRFDVIYRRNDLFSSEYLLAKMFGIPSVKEVNGLIVDEIRVMGLGNSISLRVMDWIERFNMPKADKTIVVTSKLKEVLQEEYKVPGDKIVVILNGANTDLFKPVDTTISREKLKLNQSNSYVCFVGTFHAWHGLEYLIRSAPLILQECPETRFLMVGDGSIKQELINLAEQVGISDKMIFVGMVPYQEVPVYINASDVCVLPLVRNPRNCKMGVSPLKLYEYMACGKPVVTGNVEGARQDVISSGSGLVIDSESVDEMAGAIVTLLKNEQMRKEMGERAKKAAVEKHSWPRIAERVAEVCQSVVKQK